VGAGSDGCRKRVGGMAQQRDAVHQVIGAQRDALSERIVARQYSLQPERWEPYGDVGRTKSVRDAAYHLLYLDEAIAASDPSLFVDYVAWVKVLFANLGFQDDVLVTTLECTREVLREALPSEMVAVVHEYIEAGLRHLEGASQTVPSFLSAGAPLGGLTRRYLDALLRGERHLASRLILDAVEEGVSVKDIYLHVFQPSQREIGRLWQMNQLSVAQEHYCTAATQLVMSQLYPYIFSAPKLGRRLVATCVGGELHELGARMVADFFEMAGWDTYYLGANTPTAGVLQTLGQRSPDVLAISATMTFHVSAVAELIADVRASDVGERVSVLVGGYPFNVAPDLWQRLGADGCAKDAEEAVAVANRLVVDGVQ
jgi:methanogenic corrinoid protein MtbC1